MRLNSSNPSGKVRKRRVRIFALLFAIAFTSLSVLTTLQQVQAIGLYVDDNYDGIIEDDTTNSDETTTINQDASESTTSENSGENSSGVTNGTQVATENSNTYEDDSTSVTWQEAGLEEEPEGEIQVQGDVYPIIYASVEDDEEGYPVTYSDTEYENPDYDSYIYTRKRLNNVLSGDIPTIYALLDASIQNAIATLSTDLVLSMQDGKITIYVDDDGKTGLIQPGYKKHQNATEDYSQFTPIDGRVVKITHTNTVTSGTIQDAQIIVQKNVTVTIELQNEVIIKGLSDTLSPIDIQGNAYVTLELADSDQANGVSTKKENWAKLYGGKQAPAISLSPEATLEVIGPGGMQLIGGSGARAISYSSADKQGGTLTVKPSARIEAFSETLSSDTSTSAGAGKAIYVKEYTIDSGTARLIQGEFSSKIKNVLTNLNDQGIKIENINNPDTDNYFFNIPSDANGTTNNLMCFAITLSNTQGKYVAYIAADKYKTADDTVVSSVNTTWQTYLLANDTTTDEATRTHVFDLSLASTNEAVIRSLYPSAIRYTIQLLSTKTGGTFNNVEYQNNILTTAAYGERLTKSGYYDYAKWKLSNYTAIGWFKYPGTHDKSYEWVLYDATNATSGVTYDRVRQAMTLYIGWEPDNGKVTITFADSNGTPIITEEFRHKTIDYKTSIASVPNYESKILPPLNANGYVSSGIWKLYSTGEVWDMNTVIYEDITLCYELLREVTLKFTTTAASQVSGMPTSTLLGIESKTISSPTQEGYPQRQGYKFGGWRVTHDGKTWIWDFDNDVIPSVIGELEFEAVWYHETVKVVFLVDEDKGESAAPGSVTVNFGESITEAIKRLTGQESLKAVKTTRSGEFKTDYTIDSDSWYKDAKFTEKCNLNDVLKSEVGELILYPQWKQETCYVFFKAGADDAVMNTSTVVSMTNDKSMLYVKVPYGSTLSKMGYSSILSSLFTLKGHSVSNWKVVEGNVKTFDDSTVLTGDITVQAIWEVNKYTITYKVTQTDAPELNSAQMTSKPTSYGTAVAKSSYPTTAQKAEYPGHTFQGWYTKADGQGEKWLFSGEEGAMKIEDNITLYAYWTPDKYTVSFYTFDGDESVIPESLYPVYYGDKLKEPTYDGTRDHYTLGDENGNLWGTKDENGTITPWNFTTDTVKGDMTLYAIWLGEPIDIVLHVLQEEENDPPYEEHTFLLRGRSPYRYGDKLSADDLKPSDFSYVADRVGYTLNGWYFSDYFTDMWDYDKSIAEPADDSYNDDGTRLQLNLYAYWTWNTYTVTFVTYEGDTNAPAAQEVKHGLGITKPTDPTRDHYNFGGWYTTAEATDGTEWTFENPNTNVVTGEMVLYAKWIPHVYLLSFETNGGTGLLPIEVTYGTVVPASMMITTKTGYVVTWYRDAEFTNGPIDTTKPFVDGDMTIYAKWDLKKYTVRLHYRVSESSLEEEIVTFTDTYQAGSLIYVPEKTKANMTLSSWYSDSSYQTRWVLKRDTVQGDTDLYAYWAYTKYPVHFDTGGGSKIADIELAWGTLITDLQVTPEREGYKFIGWYADENRATEWDFENNFISGETTLYAGWEAKKYDITFDLNGGKGSIAVLEDVPYDSLISEPVVKPTRSGYIFAGWAVTSVDPNKDSESEDTTSSTKSSASNSTNQKQVEANDEVNLLEAQLFENVLATQFLASTSDTIKLRSVTEVMLLAAIEDFQQENNAWDFATDTVKGAMTLTALWYDPTQDSSASSSTVTASTANAGNTTGTGTVDATNALASAAQALKAALTGDNAPWTYTILSVILATIAAVWAIFLRMNWKR
jgi:uncharacterized repeat protein (TIGR02543 family)